MKTKSTVPLRCAACRDLRRQLREFGGSAELIARSAAHSRETGHANVTSKCFQASPAPLRRRINRVVRFAVELFWSLGELLFDYLGWPVAVVLGVTAFWAVAQAPPLFCLVLLPLLTLVGHLGARRSKLGASWRKLFDGVRELSLWLLPGVLVWSAIYLWMRHEGIRGWMKLADTEQKVRGLDELFVWIRRIGRVEIATALLVLLLYLFGRAASTRGALLRVTRSYGRRAGRASMLWLGLTMFTVLDPGSAMRNQAKRIREQQDALIAKGRRYGREIFRIAFADGVREASKRSQLAPALRELDDDATRLQDCHALEHKFREAIERCPEPVDWAKQSWALTEAVDAAHPWHAPEMDYAARALENLTGEEIDRRLDALERPRAKGAPEYASPIDRVLAPRRRQELPSEEIQNAAAKLAELAYDRAVASLDGRIPEWASPIVNAVVHGPAKHWLGTAAARSLRWIERPTAHPRAEAHSPAEEMTETLAAQMDDERVAKAVTDFADRLVDARSVDVEKARESATEQIAAAAKGISPGRAIEIERVVRSESQAPLSSERIAELQAKEAKEGEQVGGTEGVLRTIEGKLQDSIEDENSQIADQVKKWDETLFRGGERTEQRPEVEIGAKPPEEVRPESTPVP